MKTKQRVLTQVLPLALAACCMAAPVQAQDANATSFHVGLTGISGFGKLKEAIQQNNPALSISDLGVGVGISFSAYKPVSGNFLVGGGIGPIIAGFGDASFTIVPVSLGVGYRFGEAASGSGYVRLAAEKALASGDFVTNSSAGVVALVGYESGGRFGWGVELGYHSSKVAVAATPGHGEKQVKPYEATLTVFFRF